MSESDTAITAQGFGKCERPERYIKQLVSHWSHKFETAFTDGTGSFPFSELESAVMSAMPGGIAITLTTAEQDRNVHMRGVIERHIDRFAFKEAPLNYEWKEAEEA